ncbi:MAG: M24 family metallopeptidase [Oscillospiraceae bacterium]|jgi:Xaa-Pro dipeptidase
MKQNRVNAVLANLETLGLSQILITDPLSIFYLTGRLIRPLERFYALYLNRNGNHKIFINQLETVPEDLGVEKVRFTDTDPYLDLVIQAIDAGEPLGIDKKMAARFLLPLMDRSAATSYVNASVAVDKSRSVKDPEEQALMRKASQINDMAMNTFKTLLRPNISELSVAGQIKQIYLDLGAEDVSFDPLVCFGANAANGHHYPDDTSLKAGDCVLFDVGCLYQGYCSDMTRTYFYQEVSPKHREIYETVLKANCEAEQAIRPGVPLRELDGIARGIITESGYGPNFTHRLGHFIGLEVHDFGDVSSIATDSATPGNLFSIEPGIYLPGEMGVRIEDLVLVTETGYERLNHLSKELEIIL